MNREDRLDRLEVEVRSLQQVLERLEDRLRAVEGGALPAAGMVTAGAETAAEAAPDGMPAPAERGGIPADATDHAGRAFLGDLGLVGRTLMVLGGAFLLRAVTETPSVPDAAGVGLGLAYALLWLALAWRVAGRRPASHSATYHALAYSLIAFPLVAEAVLRFAVLPAVAGAAVLAAVTAAGLAVAVHRSRRLAGWLVTVAAVGAAAVLLVASSQPAAYCAFLLTLGIAALWLGERHAWRGLRWPTAAAADAALLLPLVLLGHDRWPAGSGILLALQLALLVSYAATFSWRGVTREAWRVGPFALLQTCAALAVGYGGAIWVAHRVTEDTGAVAAAGLVLAVAALTAAALLLGRRAERRNAFLYHAAVGCPLLLGATGLLLPNAAEALLWSILAVLLAVAAARLVSVTLAAMAALFAVSAATTGGLLAVGFWSLAAPAARPWPPLGAATLVVLAATVVMLLTPLPRQSRFWGRGAIVPRLVLLAVLVLGLAATILTALAPRLAGVPGSGAVDAGVLAALRTAVLAVLALAAALAARWPRLAEARMLVYPLLALGAVKLAVEDLPMGRPATLFAGLAVYGAALILAPRLLARSER